MLKEGNTVQCCWAGMVYGWVCKCWAVLGATVYNRLAAWKINLALAGVEVEGLSHLCWVINLKGLRWKGLIGILQIGIGLGALKVIWECNLSSYDALMVITHGIFFR